MEKFTVDLEKVLDDFEFNEDKEEITPPSHNDIRNHLSLNKNIPNYQEFAGNLYNRSSSKPINLADADFSANVQKSNHNEISTSYVFPRQASGSNVIVKNIDQIYSDAVHNNSNQIKKQNISNVKIIDNLPIDNISIDNDNISIENIHIKTSPANNISLNNQYKEKPLLFYSNTSSNQNESKNSIISSDGFSIDKILSETSDCSTSTESTSGEEPYDISIENVISKSDGSSSSYDNLNRKEKPLNYIINKSTNKIIMNITPDIIEPISLPDVASAKTKPTEKFDLINDRVLNAIIDSSSTSEILTKSDDNDKYAIDKDKDVNDIKETINSSKTTPICFNSIPQPTEIELNQYLNELEDIEDENNKLNDTNYINKFNMIGDNSSIDRIHKVKTSVGDDSSIEIIHKGNTADYINNSIEHIHKIDTIGNDITGNDDGSVEEMSSLPIISTDEDFSSSQTEETISSSIDQDNDTNTNNSNNKLNIEENNEEINHFSEFDNLISESTTTNTTNNSKRNSNSSSDIIEVEENDEYEKEQDKLKENVKEQQKIKELEEKLKNEQQKLKEDIQRKQDINIMITKQKEQEIQQQLLQQQQQKEQKIQQLLLQQLQQKEQEIQQLLQQKEQEIQQQLLQQQQQKEQEMLHHQQQQYHQQQVKEILEEEQRKEQDKHFKDNINEEYNSNEKNSIDKNITNEFINNENIINKEQINTVNNLNINNKEIKDEYIKINKNIEDIGIINTFQSNDNENIENTNRKINKNIEDIEIANTIQSNDNTSSTIHETIKDIEIINTTINNISTNQEIVPIKTIDISNDKNIEQIINNEIETKTISNDNIMNSIHININEEDKPTKILNTNYVIEISQPCIDYRIKEQNNININESNKQIEEINNHVSNILNNQVENEFNNETDINILNIQNNKIEIELIKNESQININELNMNKEQIDENIQEKLSINETLLNNIYKNQENNDNQSNIKENISNIIINNYDNEQPKENNTEMNTNLNNTLNESNNFNKEINNTNNKLNNSIIISNENNQFNENKIQLNISNNEIITNIESIKNNIININSNLNINDNKINNELNINNIEHNQEITNTILNSNIKEKCCVKTKIIKTKNNNKNDVKNNYDNKINIKNNNNENIEPCGIPTSSSSSTTTTTNIYNQIISNNEIENNSNIKKEHYIIKDKENDKILNQIVSNDLLISNINNHVESINSDIKSIDNCVESSDSDIKIINNCVESVNSGIKPEYIESSYNNNLTSPDCYVEEKSIASIQKNNEDDIEENQSQNIDQNTSSIASNSSSQNNSTEPVIHVEEPVDKPPAYDTHSEPTSTILKPIRPNSLDLPSSPSVSLSPSETPPNLSDSEQQAQQSTSTANLTPRDSYLGKRAPFWVPDTSAPNCMHCHIKFTLVKRRHHCRACGQVLCSKCCNLKAALEYLQFSQERVCLVCFELLAKQALDRKPNPNNPMEYCSTIPPLQQVASTANQPPPSVMVPVSVLKREGSLKNKEGKQVMFSDGIKPGGDLTELDNEREVTKLPVSRKRITKRVGTPPGNLFMHKRPLHPDSNSFIPKEGLPPTIMKHKGGEITYTEFIDPMAVNDPAVKFAIHRNLFAHVRKVSLNCCLGKKRTIWNVTSEGLCCVGQDELVFMLECSPEEERPPQHIFHVILNICNEASRGSTVTEMCFVPSPVKDLFDHKDNGGFIFIRRTFQCINQLILPECPYLFGILIHRWEIPWAKLFPLRLILRMGAELKCYPSPLLSIRDREPLFMDIGQTIINLLADFRSYAYSLPTVRGLVIHMEPNKTKIIIPRNHYDQVVKAITYSNDSHLAFAGNFSASADSHLVCVQNIDDENSYNTQTIHREGKQANITGLSFIVFNASLKSSDGMSGKASISEDGLIVNILPEYLVKLRSHLHEMKEFTIECGPHAEELIQIIWGPNDLNFNVGVKSCIDGLPFDGIQSIRVHGGTDYTGSMKLIRWTEVFMIETSDKNIKSTEDPIDHMKKLTENIAKATCICLISMIDTLMLSNVEKFAIRIKLHSDDVGYEAGSGGEKFTANYMKNLDEGLIPIIHQAAVNLNNSPLTLELVFRIMEQG